MTGTNANYITVFAPLIVVFAIMWLFILRPQKKKDNKIADMRKNLSVGDEVVTIGGAVGKIMKVKDDTVVIQIGAEKNRLEFKKWAISEVTVKAENTKTQIKKEEETEEVEDAAAPKKRRRLVKKEDSENKTTPVESVPATETTEAKEEAVSQ